MKKKKIIALIAALFMPFQFAFAQTGNKDIKQQSRQLSDVRKTIKRKQLEKDRLMLQEKVFKRELSSLNEAIEKAEEKLEKLSSDIKNAEKNLAAASAQYNKASRKRSDWNRAMLNEIDFYNKMTFLLSYEDDPVEYKIRQAALKYKKDNFEKEAKTVNFSTAEVERWEKAKKKLISLRAEENATAKERKKLIKEKSVLLKSTVNKRAAAEKEIKTLNETAKAMKNLINKLSEAQKKKQTGTSIRTPDAAAHRKKSLPWPVEGEIIVKFGKSRHPELDTYIISNGIKIDAADFAQIKSVDSGTVVFTGNFRSYGKVVIVDHKNSYFAVYGHLDEILVKEEQRVSRGTVIARLGQDSDSILYFEIRQNNAADNPLLWLIKK